MIDEILLQVEKPARYIGNEVNMVVKNPKDVDIRFAFCFPDVYEVGMSHLGLQILYYFINRREDTYCERCFTPWVDMEKKMRENDIPLFCQGSAGFGSSGKKRTISAGRSVHCCVLPQALFVNVAQFFISKTVQYYLLTLQADFCYTAYVK